MNNGMKPGIFHNPDPTYEKAATKIKKEAQKTEAEVKNFFEEMRKCRHTIDSLNQCKMQYEMDMISLKATRYDEDRVSGGKTSDLSDMVIAFEEKMKASEELRISELNKYGDMRTKGFKLISLLSEKDGIFKSILIDRYFLCQSWRIIANSHHFAYKYCVDLRSLGIRKIAEKINIRNNQEL
ncbi:MAG: hypothetical protein ACFNO4_00125 [Dialister invisus]